MLKSVCCFKISDADVLIATTPKPICCFKSNDTGADYCFKNNDIKAGMPF